MFVVGSVGHAVAGTGRGRDMHAAHYLAELRRIVRSAHDEETDSHGNTWTRQGGEFVCESWEWRASMCEAGGRLSVRITAVDQRR